MDRKTINLIGFWVIRLTLVGTGIFFLAKGNSDYALGCGMAVLMTFVYEGMFT